MPLAVTCSSNSASATAAGGRRRGAPMCSARSRNSASAPSVALSALGAPTITRIGTRYMWLLSWSSAEVALREQPRGAWLRSTDAPLACGGAQRGDGVGGDLVERVGGVADHDD